jgi:hypothetical protein
MTRKQKLTYILLGFFISLVVLGVALGYFDYYRKAVNLVKFYALEFADNTNHLLAEPGSYYIVYAEKKVKLDLTASPGLFVYEWYNPKTGKTVGSGKIEGGSVRTFLPPGSGDFILSVRAAAP